MSKGTAIFVVGHKQWGKSRTLRALTDDVSQRRYVTIDNDEYFVRKMSNDDLPKKLEDLIKGLDPATQRRVIIALCPENGEGNNTDKILGIAKQKYRLYFFVLKHQYGESREITSAETNRLAKYGEVLVYPEKGKEANVRAIRLEAYARSIKKGQQR